MSVNVLLLAVHCYFLAYASQLVRTHCLSVGDVLVDGGDVFVCTLLCVINSGDVEAKNMYYVVR